MTDKHQAAIRARGARLEVLSGSVETRSIYRAPSRAIEDAYYAELEREQASRYVDEAIDGALPPEYDASMALITLREAARRLGRSEVTMRSAIRRGRMTGHKYGRDWLVEESAVEWYRIENLGRVGWPKGRKRKVA